MTQKPYGTVLLKAAKIIDYLAEFPQCSLQEIAQATEMTNSTTLKILETLVLIGYVARDKQKNYRLGSKLIRYANQNLDELDLVEISLPFLKQLQKSVDETIHLGILASDEILYVNKLEPQHQTIRMSSKVGITRPLYCSAMGKAVLAEFSEDERQNYLAKTPLIPYTEHTITNTIRLDRELAQVQQEQIAFDDEEVEKEVFCIGTALHQNGEIIGAFSVSLPKYRLDPEFKRRMIAEIKNTREQIEAALSEK